MRTATSLFILLLLTSSGLFGQDRYMVFFKDKANSSFTIQNPSDYLSARAINRRSKQNIIISEQDLPVNNHYVTQVADLGIETYYTTKWMNGVLVQMEHGLENDVLNLPFVDRIEYVAPGAILSPPPGEIARDQEDPIPDSRISERQYEMLELDIMHREGFLGQGVMIGIFDDGFQNYNSIPAFNHLIAENRIVYTEDFSKNRTDVENGFNHGLRVFSILGADSQDMIGAAPAAQYILSVTEASGEYRIEEYNWLFAAEKADSAGVDVINTSLGYSVFSDPTMNYTTSDMDGQTAVITQAANITSSKGILIVVSAGNTGGSAWNIITAPADSEEVLSIGAIDENEQLANFSGVGPTADNRIKPDVVAIGVNTMLTNVQGNVAFQNGTSFSSPLVAGLAAGLVQAFPDMSSQEIKNAIRQSGDRAQAPDNLFGYGIPGFIRASIIVKESLIPITEGIVAYPNPTNLSYVTLTFSDGFIGKSINAQLLNGKGELLEQYAFKPLLFDNQLQIDLRKANSGLLLMRLITEAGVITKKIIKSQ